MKNKLLTLTDFTKKRGKKINKKKMKNKKDEGTTVERAHHISTVKKHEQNYIFIAILLLLGE